MATASFNGLPVEFLGQVPNNWGDTVWDQGEQQRNQLIYNYLKGNRRNRNKIYGVGGVKLPSIGGLRIRRKAKTRLGVRDVITDSNGMIYGYANPAANLKIGMVGSPGNRYLSLARNNAAPRKGGAAAAPAAAGATNPKPPVNDPNAPDNFTGYGDYPMIATYLRGLQQQQTDWNNNWQKGILPAVTSGLTNIANIGAGIAQQYAGSVGTTGAPGGTVSNAYNVAAGITPAQVAGGLGGATQTYNPNVQAMGQGSASAAGAGARASGTYNALAAAAAPVSATQGILANLTRQAQTISQSYADKRLTERLRLDQWIQEQKIAQQTAQAKADYTAGVLKLSGAKVEETGRHNLATEQQAAQALSAKGQKTRAELALKGFIPVPKNPGAKSAAVISRLPSAVASDTGETMYQPKANKSSGTGGGGGGGTATAKQKQDAIKELRNAYLGNATDALGNVIGTTDKGYRQFKSINDQTKQIYSFVFTGVKNGLIGNTSDLVETFLIAALPPISYWDETQGKYVAIKNGKKSIINRIIGGLRRAKVIK